MRLATSFLLFATGLVWLAWELVTIAKHEPGQAWATISVVMSNAALHSCALPFGVSLMVAHWWLNWDRADARAPFTFWPAWVATLAVLLVLDLAFARFAPPRDSWPHWLRIFRYPGLWATAGFLMGPLTWPQRAGL